MQRKLCGTTGRILRANMGMGRVSVEEIDEPVVQKYLGGTCLGVKYLHEEVPPGIDWADPQNHIYVGSGPLGGTRVAGSGCFSIVTKGPKTNGVTSSQANGFLGAYLKFSGFDGIVIQGCAPTWKYLHVYDGEAELRDAEHLVGLDTWRLEDSIKKELGYSEREASVFGIGPAGENLVKIAGVLGDRGHSASHNGLGAVFGSKRLKAIAVSRSAGKVQVADNARLSIAAKQLVENFKKAADGEIFNWGTSRAVGSAAKGGYLPVKNYTTSIFPEAANFDVRERFEVWKAPCWACPSSHHMHIRVTDGPYAGFTGKEPEYEQYAAFGPQIGNTEPGAAIVLANEADRLGLEANESGWIVGWAMECYEKGLLSSKDLDGLEMTWGNVEATRTLLKNIAYRRGFGRVMGEGIKYAAEQVGGESPGMAIVTMKGNTPRSHDHRGRWWEMLDTCVSESATLQNMVFLFDLSPYGLPKTFDPFSCEQVSMAVGKTTGTMTFADSLVVCWFATCGEIPLLCEALNAATGWDFSFDQCLAVGRRGVNLMRVYNLKCGMTPDMEYPSPKYWSTPVDGPNEGKSIKPYWDGMIDNYYRLMGWDRKTGWPLPETLADLGLEWLAGR